MTETEANTDILAAVADFGARASRIVPLNPEAKRIDARASFRVDLDGGTVIKLRRLETEAAAQQQQALRSAVPPAFAPVLGRFGKILIEGWIEGRPLPAGAPATEHLQAAARILAELHAVPEATGRPLPMRAPLGAIADEVLAYLGELAAAGALPAGIAARLADRVRRTAPAAAGLTLIHTDLCGENMVVDPAGRLHVIDNEHFRIGPPGMDLARSWYRWGLYREDFDTAQWQVFCYTYTGAGGQAEALADQAFWRIAAVALSARLRLRMADPTLAEPIQCLIGIAAADPLPESPKP